MFSYSAVYIKKDAYLGRHLSLFIPAKQQAKCEQARIWRLPRGSNTPPLGGGLAKKKLGHAL